MSELERLLQKLNSQYKKVELTQAVGTETELFIALADLEGLCRAAQWHMNDLKFKKS